MEKTAASAGLGAAGRRIGPDIRRDRIQKTGKTRKRTLFACLLGAHGRCQRVDHSEPIRMTFHVIARRPGYRPRPAHGSSVPFPAIKQQRTVSSP